MQKYDIEIKNLIKRFNSFELGPINMKIPKGSIVGYIGQNGAGKSTTIKLLLKLLKKDFGKIKILNDENIDKNSIGVVFDDLLFPEVMNLKEINTFCSMIYTNWDKNLFYNLKEKFNLPEKLIIKDYSRGMKMKLSFAIALSHNASVLILDEATSGLDPIIRDEVLNILLDFVKNKDKTIFISSHITSDLEKIADYIAFIHDGKLLFFEKKDEILKKYAICKLTNNLNKDSIIKTKKDEALVNKELLSDNIKTKNPSIEDIMIFFIKGDENNESTNF